MSNRSPITAWVEKATFIQQISTGVMNPAFFYHEDYVLSTLWGPQDYMNMRITFTYMQTSFSLSYEHFKAILSAMNVHYRISCRLLRILYHQDSWCHKYNMQTMFWIINKQMNYMLNISSAENIQVCVILDSNKSDLRSKITQLSTT